MASFMFTAFNFDLQFSQNAQALIDTKQTHSRPAENRTQNRRVSKGVR